MPYTKTSRRQRFPPKELRSAPPTTPVRTYSTHGLLRDIRDPAVRRMQWWIWWRLGPWAEEPAGMPTQQMYPDAFARRERGWCWDDD